MWVATVLQERGEHSAVPNFRNNRSSASILRISILTTDLFMFVVHAVTVGSLTQEILQKQYSTFKQSACYTF